MGWLKTSDKMRNNLGDTSLLGMVKEGMHAGGGPVQMSDFDSSDSIGSYMEEGRRQEEDNFASQIGNQTKGEKFLYGDLGDPMKTQGQFDMDDLANLFGGVAGAAGTAIGGAIGGPGGAAAGGAVGNAAGGLIGKIEDWATHGKKKKRMQSAMNSFAELDAMDQNVGDYLNRSRQGQGATIADYWGM